MFLVIYWYNEYSSIDVTLKLTRTKYKAIELSRVSVSPLCNSVHEKKCDSDLQILYKRV